MTATSERQVVGARTHWMVIARALRLLPNSLRRRLWQSVAAAALMAVIESASFSGLFLMIRVLADSEAPVPELGGILGVDTSRGSFLARCGLAVLGLFVTRSIGSLVLLRRQAALQAEADSFLSTSLFRRYLSTPYLQFIQRNSSELLVNIQYRAADVAANSLGATVTIASELAVLVGVSATLAVVEPALAAGVLAFFGLVVVGLLKVLTPRIRRAGRIDAIQSVKSQQLLQEAFGGIKTIKANELAPTFIREFTVQREELALTRRRRVFFARLPQFYLENSLLVGVAVLAVIVFQRESTELIAVFGLLVAAAFRMLPSLSRVVGALGAVRGSEAALEAIERDMSTASLEEPDNVPRIELTDVLKLDRLTFRYGSDGAPALIEISIEVRAGESIGIVGPSGAGKTTLVDLVLGLLRPTEGEIKLDGSSLDGERLRGWRHAIGYVPQDVFLLDASLRDNIVFGRPVSEERLVRAVGLAELNEVVGRLPDAEHTIVGERGVRLSGGQRQRIGLARALYSEPTLLILDEATAALDTRTEAAVSASIAALRGRTTTLVIAHRLSTVQRCDRIALLDAGRLRAVGTFQSLQQEDELFAELVRLNDLSTPDDAVQKSKTSG